MKQSARDVAQQLLESACKKADAAEVLLQESESRSVKFQDNRLKTVSTKAVRGVGLRVIHNGRLGFSSTNDLDTLDSLVEHALHSAAFGQEAKFEFPGNAAVKPVRIHDDAVCELSMERAAEMMQSGVECVLEARPDAQCSGGVGRSVGRTVLCNSAGLFCEEESTHFGMGIDALIVKGESLLWVDEGEDSCRFCGDILKHAQKVNEWIRLSEKETRPTGGKMPVVFTPRALAILLSSFVANVNGKTVQKGASLLAEKLGEKVLDERVTILDDPLVDYASGSYATDAEGVSAGTKPLFEDGVLRHYLFDLQTAALMGAESTGNGLRSYASQPHPGVANLRMAPGTTPVKELLAGIRRGLLIDQALGAGQSNVLAGEFSVNVELGFLIENGEVVARVKDCMLAGNAFDAFNHIRAISAETEWHGAAELPTVCFESLSVVGRGG